MGNRNIKRPVLIVILVIVVIFIVLVFVTFNILNKNKQYSDDTADLLNVSKQSTFFEEAIEKEDCGLYGTLPIESYLPLYKVKSGDTLQGITNTQLNNPGRIGEVVKLNNKKYPSLSIQNPYIEVGWEIILPPKSSQTTNGNIVVVSGNLSKSDKGWGIGYPNARTGPFELKYLPQELEEGECIIVVYEGKDPETFLGNFPVFDIVKQ